MGLADLHIHTKYSYDGTASVEKVLRRARQIGLDVIAITDHDEIRGALEAERLAPRYGIEVIPGCEITTAEGDLLALFIREKVPAKLSLVETVLKVRALGGACIVAHPMCRGMGMNSASYETVIKALRHPQVAETLIGIEAYNGTSLDRMSNHYARVLALHAGTAAVGNSDAHIVETIGFGATEFEGRTTEDLLRALKNRETQVRKLNEWSGWRVLSSWGMKYALNLLGNLRTSELAIEN